MKRQARTRRAARAVVDAAARVSLRPEALEPRRLLCGFVDDSATVAGPHFMYSAAEIEAKAAAGFSAHVDFQPAGAATTAGYVADLGQLFAPRDGRLTYGWNAFPTAAVERNSPSSPDQKSDTSIALGAGKTWELAVPNGTYHVTVGAGDAAVTTGAIFRTNVEGTLAIDAKPSLAERFFAGTVTVAVTDGRLTIDNASGAKHNTLTYVDVKPASVANFPASTDAKMIAFTVAVAAAQLPTGWSSQDVGSTALGGSTTYDPDTGTFAVRGSGADIFGTKDAFQFAYTSLTGDGQIIARVNDVENTNASAKAGVMIRESLTAGSRNAFMQVKATTGAEYQSRASTGGSTTYKGVSGVAAPQWVRLVRSGNTFTGYRSPDGVDWTLASSSTVAMAQTVYVGLAVTAHDSTKVNTSTFGSVAIAGTTTTDPGLAAPSQLTATPTAAGAPTAIRLTWKDNASTETGVAVQRSTDGGSTFADLAVASGASVSEYTDSAVTSGKAYVYRVRAVGPDGTFSAFSDLATGVAPGGTTAAAWTGGDLGSVAAAGSNSTSSSGVITVKGAGGDIYGSADAFRFVRQQIQGPTTIIARVASEQAVDPFTKAGIMFRESLTAGSRNVLLTVTPSNGVFMQVRTGNNSPTKRVGSTISGRAPIWLKLVRDGSDFTGYCSTNGTTWTLVGTTSAPMATTSYVGFAVTSHKGGTLATATFDHVTVTPDATPGWQRVADAPVAKYEHAGLAVGGKLYSMGGFFNAKIEATVKSEAYDPVRNTWSVLKDLPEPVTHAGQATDGRYIYMMGGFVGNHPGPMTKHVWRYDTVNNVYAAMPDLPELIGAGGGAIVGRTLYFFGGTHRTLDGTANGKYVSDSNKTWSLDLDAANPTWVAQAAIPESRNHLGGITLNGQIYAVGGQQLGSEITGNRTTVNRYDPETDTWTTVAPLPIPTGHLVSSTFVLNGRIRVIGGVTSNSLEQDTVFEYDPATDRWSTLPPIPGRRQSPVADAINGVVYVSGGFEPGVVYVDTYKGV